MTDLPAYRWLLENQRQLDQDGVEVGVSRQALTEVLDSHAVLLQQRDDLVAALEAARGWIVTCSESAQARKDLKLVDAALASIRATHSHGET